MNTIEFQASIKNGVIQIPAEYQQDLQNTDTIAVTIQKVVQKRFSSTGIIDRLTKNPVVVEEVKPFTREETHDRRL
ncbi:MAG: hypothetical protein AAFP03_11045 [Cyanobacteria bacterium J06598_3]